MGFFPTQSFLWTNDRLALTTNPPGTLRFGTLVRQPVDLVEIRVEHAGKVGHARAAAHQLRHERRIPAQQLAVDAVVEAHDHARDQRREALLWLAREDEVRLIRQITGN